MMVVWEREEATRLGDESSESMTLRGAEDADMLSHRPKEHPVDAILSF